MSKRILVVEDQEDNRRILRDMLGNAGYELVEAETGEEALTAVEAQRPDLISGTSNVSAAFLIAVFSLGASTSPKCSARLRMIID
jgi:DNA-binding NtrC family response regulator